MITPEHTHLSDGPKKQKIDYPRTYESILTWDMKVIHGEQSKIKRKKELFPLERWKRNMRLMSSRYTKWMERLIYWTPELLLPAFEVVQTVQDTLFGITAVLVSKAGSLNTQYSRFFKALTRDHVSQNVEHALESKQGGLVDHLFFHTKWFWIPFEVRSLAKDKSLPLPALRSISLHDATFISGRTAVSSTTVPL